MLIVHYENIKLVLTKWIYYNLNPSATWNEAGVTCPTMAGKTNAERNKICLMLTPNALTIGIFVIEKIKKDSFQNSYLKYFARYLSEQFQIKVGEQFDSC